MFLNMTTSSRLVQKTDTLAKYRFQKLLLVRNP